MKVSFAIFNLLSPYLVAVVDVLFVLNSVVAVDDVVVDVLVSLAVAVAIVPVTNFSTLSWFLDRGRGPCLPGRRPSRYRLL